MRFLFFIKILTASLLVSSYQDASGQAPLKVLVFYSTDCPICQQYTGVLGKMAAEWEDVEWELVYSRKGERKRDVREFEEKYGLEMEWRMDRRGKLRERFGATHNPEAFLLDGEGNVRYRGRIDNLYVSLGKRRGVVTEHYLEEALEALRDGQAVLVTRTEPVGCLLE